MTTLEMVNMHTNNGTKAFARVTFDGWMHDPNEVISILESQGYKVPRDCCTYRHHAIITGQK